MKFLLDPKLNQRSVTLTLVVISFILTVLSLITSHIFISCLPASVLSISLFALNMLFYRLRRIDEFSLNLKTGEISAQNKEDVSKV